MFIKKCKTQINNNSTLNEAMAARTPKSVAEAAPVYFNLHLLGNTDI